VVAAWCPAGVGGSTTSTVDGADRDAERGRRKRSRLRNEDRFTRAQATIGELTARSRAFELRLYSTEAAAQRPSAPEQSLERDALAVPRWLAAGAAAAARLSGAENLSATRKALESRSLFAPRKARR
jgi:hypothetical protein